MQAEETDLFSICKLRTWLTQDNCYVLSSGTVCEPEKTKGLHKGTQKTFSMCLIQSPSIHAFLCIQIIEILVCNISIK